MPLASPDALRRIEFRELTSPIPLQTVIQEANRRVEVIGGMRLLVVAGRSRRLAAENHREELKVLREEHSSVGSEVEKTIGDVATAFIVANCGSGVVVVQAATTKMK